MKARVGFVIEQALGHVAYGMSLRNALAPRDDIEVVWIEVPYERRGLTRLPPFGNWTVRGSLRARRLVARAHAERPLDALFLHTQTISLFSGGLMRRIPTLLSLDATPLNLDTLAGPYDHAVAPAPVERLKRSLQRRTWRYARAYTTWSQWAKDSLVRDYDVAARDVTVVHPGTMLANFPRRDPAPRDAARPLQVLFVGADLHRKGGDLLIDVCGSLHGAVELHLVTKSVVPASPGVRVYHDVRPHSPELLALYRNADVFALPTRGDCLAVVLGEAMAASLPIVTTNVGAHAEAVEDGASGYVIPVDDAAALRDRLQRLAGDRALVARMGTRARAIAEERFDMAKGANTLGDILVRIATLGRAGVAPAPRMREAV